MVNALNKYVDKFYSSLDDGGLIKSVMYFYEVKTDHKYGEYLLAYTINFENNNIYTKDVWTWALVKQSFVKEYGDSHWFLDRIFKMRIKNVIKEQE